MRIGETLGNLGESCFLFSKVVDVDARSAQSVPHSVESLFLLVEGLCGFSALRVCACELIPHPFGNFIAVGDLLTELLSFFLSGLHSLACGLKVGTHTLIGRNFAHEIL